MEVIVYSKTSCPYCVQAKAWMDQHKVAYKSIVMDDYEERQAFYKAHNNEFGTVPQIFVDGKRIGGYTDLLKSDFAAQIQAGNFDADF